MNIIEKLVLTEREAIEFCILNEIKGAKRQLQSFEKNNKLTGTNQKKALKLNLATLADDVEVNGEGVQRIYTLRGLKANPIQRITGNSTNGAKPTEFDEIIKEYFFNILSKRVAPREEGWSETYNKWGSDWINQLIVSDSDWASYHERLKETFEQYSELDEDHIRKIYMNVLENFRKNQRGLAVKFIERLEKEERIETEIEFFQAFAKNSYVVNVMTDMEDDNTKYEDRFKMHQKINDYRYVEIIEGIAKLLIPFEMTLGRYKIVSAFKHYGTDKEKEAIGVVGKWLFEEHSINYLYNRIRIFVTDPEIKLEISKEEAKEAFTNRIIEKTNKRMNRKDYKNTHKYQNAFYRLSVFLLLDSKKVEGLKEQMKMETKMIQDSIDNCKYHYAVKYGENSMQEVEEVRWAFGEKAEKQKVKLDIPFDFDDLFAPVEIEKTNVEREEIEWMNKFPIREKKTEVKTVTAKSVIASKIQTKGTIDMNLVGLEVDEPKVEKQIDNRPFGWQLEEIKVVAKSEEQKLNASLMPLDGNYTIKLQRPTSETHGSQYLGTLEQYLKAM